MTARSIRLERVGLAMLAGFLMLALAAGYWQVVRGADLRRDPRVSGGRDSALAARDPRGRILDRNGAVLAETTVEADGTRHRVYTEPGAVHVVGYFDAVRGSSGAEAAAADRLTGRAGTSIAGTLREFAHVPGPVEDVRLALDLDVQRAAVQAMNNATGAAVALDPHTGEILALVSNPGFDPGVDDRGWEQLRTRADSPLLNRATQGLYIPGSTFKTVTLAAALARGLVQPSTPAQCPTTVSVLGISIASRNEPPGKSTQTVRDAYAYSCNTFFARLGEQVGPAQLEETARAFGLLEAPPFELPTEAGHLNTTARYLEDERGLAMTAFGQGELQLSPLQLALVAAAIANDGMVPAPRLFRDDAPSEWRRALPVSVARDLAQIMAYSVEAGWASTAAVPGVRVGGKTGSAEVGAGEASHAVFIAFAPVDRPRVAVAVLKERAGAGSSQAGPVVKAIIEAALRRPER